MYRISTFWTWALMIGALLGFGLMSSSALDPRMAAMALEDLAKLEQELPPPGNPMEMNFFMPGANVVEAGAAEEEEGVADGGDEAGGGRNPDIAGAAGMMVVSAGGGLPGIGFAPAASINSPVDLASARSAFAAIAGGPAPAAAAVPTPSSDPATAVFVNPAPATAPTPTPAATPAAAAPAPAQPNPTLPSNPPVVNPPVVNPPVVDPPIVDPPVQPDPDPPVQPDPNCPTDEPCDGVTIPGAPAPRIDLAGQKTLRSLQAELRQLQRSGKSANPAFSKIRQANIERVCEQLRLTGNE